MSCSAGLFQAFAIFRLNAAESIAAVAQRDYGAGLLRDRHSRFKRGIAPAYHQDLFTPVLLGVDQTVSDFSQFFARNFQLARCAAPAYGKKHAAREVGGAVGDDRKRIAFALYLLHALTEIDLDAGLRDDILPKLQQFFLACFLHLYFADDG